MNNSTDCITLRYANTNNLDAVVEHINNINEEIATLNATEGSEILKKVHARMIESLEADAAELNDIAWDLADAY